MIVALWLFVATVGLLATAGAVLTNDDGVAILAGIAGVGAWGLAAFGALDLVVVSNGTEVAAQYPPITVFCAGMSLIPLYVALTGPINIVRRTRNPDADKL